MSKQLSNKVPAYAIHPGEILTDELEARELVQAEFADLIGMKRSQLNEILKGKRGINAETALLLEKVLKIDADFWLNAQKDYELSLAKIENKNQARLQAIEEFQLLKENIAFNFFKKQKLLSGDPVHDVPLIKKVYQITHFEELANIYASPTFARYRKSNKQNADRINVAGWTKLVGYMGSQQHVPPFDASYKKELVNGLKKIISENKDTTKKVQQLLNEAGIKLIYQEKAEKCPVDGVSFWEGENPLIGMSLRYHRLDNFAFTLFHELGHVFLHLTNNPKAEFVDLFDDESAKENKQEKEADEFARINLISEEKWNEFLSSESRMMDSYTIDFAKKIGIHPAIIKGRLKHHFNDYSIRTRIDNTLT